MNMAQIKKFIRPALRILFACAFLALITYSLFQILSINYHYSKEEKIRYQMAVYKPDLMDAATNFADGADGNDGLLTVILNQSVVDAQAINSDIVGWLSLDGTRIDYPFVIAEDNDFYLHRDINKNYSYAGTLFLDYKCSSDFSNFSTIIYGHNMKNGTMFSDLRRYDNAEFFNNNSTGQLFLADKAFSLEIFAYLLVTSDDSIIYAFDYKDENEKSRFLSYIEQKAFRYRNIGVSELDNLLIMSTCAYDFDQARFIVIARLVKI